MQATGAGRIWRRTVGFVTAALAMTALLTACTSPADTQGRDGTTSRPSTSSSPVVTGPATSSYPDFWRVRHDADPVDPRSAQMMRAIEHSSDQRYVLLSGTDSPRWGAPYYQADDATTSVTVTCVASPCFDFPASDTVQFRIPAGARPSLDADRELVVIDANPGANEVLWLWRACPPTACGRWTAHGMSMTSLSSDEIDRCWAQRYPEAVPASNLANFGHRGLPGSYLGIRYQEVAVDHSIPHVLKIALPDTASSHVYPYVGDEGRGGSIPEGTLIRLKSSVDLGSLSPAARVIAQALQTYGAVVGDTSGGPVELKVENLFVEQSPDRWASLGIDANSLSRIPLTDFEVVKLGYGSPGPAPETCPNG